jgi:hypothetical protein
LFVCACKHDHNRCVIATNAHPGGFTMIANNRLMMIAAFALVLMGQSPNVRVKVDRDYQPGVGDVALLGMVDGEHPNRVLGAECFVSRNDMTVFYESVLEQDDTQGLSRRPDYYVARAGTPAIVRALYNGEAKIRGMVTPMRYAKVEIQKGAFKGRTFYVMNQRIFRFAK